MQGGVGLCALLALGAGVSACPASPPRQPVVPPVAGRNPVELSDAMRDPVVARIHSLLVGTPRHRGAIDVVPLFARLPSEASGTDPAVPIWRARRLVVKSVAPGVVRIRHNETRPVLLVPGLFVRDGGEEIQILRADLVAPSAALHAPARKTTVPRLLDTDRITGLLPAEEVAFAILGEPVPRRSGTGAARGTRATPEYSGLVRDTAAWFPSGFESTVVGCVLLVGGEPLSTHVFASHRLFRDAWPDILATAVMAERDAARAGIPPAHLARRARRGSPRGRTLSLLRMITSLRARTREIPGGGMRWKAGGRVVGYVGHALVDADGRVLFVGIFRAPRIDDHGKAGAKMPDIPNADPEEDPTRRRGGRFNPFGKDGPFRNPGRDPLLPPR